VIWDPHSQLPWGMAGSADQLGPNLPVDGIAGAHGPVELDRVRRGDTRRDLFVQGTFPLQQLRRGQRMACGEDLRLVSGPEQIAAGPGHDLLSGPIVVGVRVGQQELADRNSVSRDTEAVGDRVKDGVVLPRDVRVDQHNPVAIANGIARDHRSTQAP
jgi:hypothetical protein